MLNGLVETFGNVQMGLLGLWLPLLMVGLAWLAVIAIIMWDVRDREQPWKRQDALSLFGLLFNLATLVAATIGVSVAFSAFKETKRQANTAEAQIGVAKDTAKRQLRAYVYVTPDGIKNLAKDDRPQGGVTVHAIGQTPAYELELITHIAVLPNPLAGKIEEIAVPPPADIVHSMLFPGTQAFNNYATLDLAPNEQQLSVIRQADQFRIYVWGVVNYKDTFSDPHHTLFCFYYDKAAIAGATSAQVCNQHVEAD